ncbi:FMN-binding protein [Mycoplasmatota bacterium]|nr:FMN-binding protein [Mycoplasmatota bacterium]
MKKRLIVISMIIIGVMVIFALSLILTLREKMEIVYALEQEELNLITVEDGNYFGEYFTEDGNFGVRVEITVQDQIITEINILEHLNALGTKAEVIIEDVLKFQSLKVDTISGATASSIAILEAIEVALIR